MTDVPPFNTLAVSLDGPVGRLALDRPDKRNALSTEVLEEPEAAARWFDTRSDVRAVVVTGTGDHFCAGADEARSLGFLNRPVPDDSVLDEATQLATELARRDYLAARGR